MAAMLSKDNDILYILVENRKETKKSFVAMNIEWFLALLESCEVEEVKKESIALRESMYHLRRKASKSARDKVNLRYN